MVQYVIGIGGGRDRFSDPTQKIDLFLFPKAYQLSSADTRLKKKHAWGRTTYFPADLTIEVSACTGKHSTNGPEKGLQLELSSSNDP